MKNDQEFVFIASDWFTPNTYDPNYMMPPERSGVYLLVYPIFKFNGVTHDVSYTILYVGSSRNLKVRYKSHEVLRVLQEQYGYIQFYFKEFDNYHEVEKQYIQQIQPKFNTQWR